MTTMTFRSFLLLVASCALAACPSTNATVTPPTAPAAASSQPTKVSDVGHGDEAEHEGHGKGAVDRETVDADGVVRRGAGLSAQLEAVPVSVAATKAGAYNGKIVKVKGKVQSVCQPMGCWFVLAGDTPAQHIRISSKGHDVFVPKSAAGMIATVEGEFNVKTVDQKTAQHYEDERELAANETRTVFTGDTQELSIAVASLELRKPAG